jgi:hypothetical protein
VFTHFTFSSLLFEILTLGYSTSTN